MQDNTDLLQRKIDQAKAQLSEDTLKAINAVDWRVPILELREKKGYTFEQLGDLDIETELVLCGLLSPENYPKELEKRMRLTKTQVADLIDYMNIRVFSRIKEEMIKNTEGKKMFVDKPLEEKNDNRVLEQAGIEIIPEKLELNTGANAYTPSPAFPKGEGTHPILAQKLSAPVQNPMIRTEHTLENLSSNKSGSVTKPVQPESVPKSYPKNADPYRLPPE